MTNSITFPSLHIAYFYLLHFALLLLHCLSITLAAFFALLHFILYLAASLHCINLLYFLHKWRDLGGKLFNFLDSVACPHATDLPDPSPLILTTAYCQPASPTPQSHAACTHIIGLNIFNFLKPSYASIKPTVMYCIAGNFEESNFCGKATIHKN